MGRKRGKGLAASRHPVEISVWEEADRRQKRRREEGEDKKSRQKVKRGEGEEQETENYIAGCCQLITEATDGRRSKL